MDRKRRGATTTQVYRRKKKRFSGNRYTSVKNTDKNSTAAKKIDNNDPIFDVTVFPSAMYLFVHWSLFLTLQNNVVCKNCLKDVEFGINNIKGVGFSLDVQCSCEKNLHIPSSPKISSGYEINRRLVYVLRLLGVGYNGFLNFCGLLDISCTGLSISGYYDCMKHILAAVTDITKLVFAKAAKEEQEKNKEKALPEDRLTVSGDGSWPKRGFSALLGIVSLIGKYSNKIIDVIVKSKICQACKTSNFPKDSPEFDAWFVEHCKKGQCKADHKGSAGLMEVEGVKELFERSIEQYDVKYEYYIGDGDTKTFKHLIDSKPYGDDVIVKKKECCLHVKKRVYTRGKKAKQQLARLRKARREAQKKVDEKKSNKKKSK